MKTKKIVSLCPPLRTPAGHYLRQKDLANVFGVTTRQIRRWERDSEREGFPTCKPYDQDGLRLMFLRRRSNQWDRRCAAELGLTELLERFERGTEDRVDWAPSDLCERSCTHLLLQLAGDQLPEGVELFNLEPRTLAEAQAIWGKVMSYAPTAHDLGKAFVAALSRYNASNAQFEEPPAETTAA